MGGGGENKVITSFFVNVSIELQASIRCQRYRSDSCQALFSFPFLSFVLSFSCAVEGPFCHAVTPAGFSNPVRNCIRDMEEIEISILWGGACIYLG